MMLKTLVVLAAAVPAAVSLDLRPAGLARRSALRGALGTTAAVVAQGVPLFAGARPEGVNKPELLPPPRPDGSRPTVIDVGVGFLTKGEQKRVEALIAKIEETGFKVRVLCQKYPQTPGLAIKDYWNVDDKTIVLIADKGLKGTSNILNFNVGDGLADVLPTIFWSRLQGRFGTSRYWRDKGEDVAIMNAVEAILTCLPNGCVDPPSEAQLTSGARL